MGDLRLSVRHLLAAPGFSAAAITVLALGIGLNAAMFSIVYAFTLAGRGFPEPDRVVQLYARDARTNATNSRTTSTSPKSSPTCSRASGTTNP